MNFSGRKSAAAALLFAALTGCAGAPPGASLSPGPGASLSPGPALNPAPPASDAPAALDAELLYDLLLADIAAQRGQHTVAIEAATRAAYRSRDRRIAGAAVRLAARAGAHARVVELAQFLAGLAPDDFRNQLTLAGAQLKTGQLDAALGVLAQVARRQPADEAGETTLQSIAELLAEAARAESESAAQILQKFDAAAAPWPRSAPLHLAVALLALELQDGAVFQRRIDHALRLRPGWQTAAMFKLAFLAEHFAVQSARFADAFLRAFPAAGRFRVHHARLLLDAGEAGAAAAQADAALRRDPQDSEALFVAAVAHFEQAQYDKAQQRMHKYLALNPRNDRARLYLADIFSARADYDAALETLREVASPAYRIDAEVAHATVLAKRDGVDAGIAHLRQVAAANIDQAVRLVLETAQLCRDYDLPLRAKAALDEGLARFPAHPDLLYNRGLLAAQLNLLDLHERDMRELIALQPDNAHAYNALGYTLADQTARLDEAFKLINKALKLQPDDPFILDSMGWVHFRLGNNARAIDYLQRALAAREDAEIAAHLGEALWVAGRRDEARAIWARGKAWGPDNATLLDTLRRFAVEVSS